MKMNIIDKLEMEQLKKDIPSFKAGDTLKVHVKITEGDKQRIQIYQGICIKRVNSGLGSSYTVRKISGSVGVERIFPLHSPNIEKIEVLRLGKVRRAKLYYLRNLRGKAARITEKRFA
jgi:large subunit ribosomal protein L19